LRAILESKTVDFFGLSPVNWRSVKLPCVVKSLTATEFVAASLTSDEIAVLQALLKEFGYQVSATRLMVENSACRAVLEGGTVDGKTKHLTVHWHCVRERVDQGVLSIEWIPTGENVADLFTKAVVPQTCCKFREALCLRK
jgi:hypothetical protein